MTIVVTGGSGFVGTALTKVLLSKGHTVIVIDKHGPALTHTNLFFIPCDLEANTLPFNVLERTDAVIHLAGKHTLSELRQDDSIGAASVKHLIASLEQTTNRPQIFISASSVGYYGTTKEADERSAAGKTETTQLIEQKETEALRAAQCGCRVVLVRTAPVIGVGGFMAPLLRAAKFHTTFRYTAENFDMPWIHINDLIHVYLFALETNTVQGPINAVAPAHTTYQEFLLALKKTAHTVIIPTLPFMQWPYPPEVREQFINQVIIPQRLLDKGFEFAFTTITEAVKDVLHRKI